MSKVVLIEDHDEALEVWRREKIKDLNLVHIDAHIDLGFHPAKSVEQIFDSTGSLKELKKRLEYSLAFLRYEKNLDKQTNIGNYIYPAMCEGIIKNFYWVVPGGLEEFKKSHKFIKNILKNFSSQNSYSSSRIFHSKTYSLDDETVSVSLLGRKFTICTLQKLLVLKQEVLLDIDTDFLLIDNLLDADNTKKIGKRKPWILPEDLVKVLKEKIKQPRLITIAYSVNGGFTPIRYKHLGDEIAYYFAPKNLIRHYENNFKAAQYFDFFCSAGRKEYYQKAIKLNPTYKAPDNNYGLLYLRIRKFFKAKKEFLRILSVDPKNPSCLYGLGMIALEKRDFKKAKEYFSFALQTKINYLFKETKTHTLLGLAKAEYRLNNFKKAKKLLFLYKTKRPLDPQSYYFLGCILGKERDFLRAASFYKDAIRLGFGSIQAIWQLLKILPYLKEKYAIIKFIIAKYKEFKKGFLRAKKSNLMAGRKLKDLKNTGKKMAALERRLYKIYYQLSLHTERQLAKTE